MEERAAGSAVRIRDLDAHHAQFEEAVDEAARHLGLIVHFADMRPDFPRSKLPYALLEQDFVLRQAGQRRRTSSFFHGAGMLSFEGHVQGAPSPRLLRAGSRACGAAGARGESAGRACSTARTAARAASGSNSRLP